MVSLSSGTRNGPFDLSMTLRSSLTSASVSQVKRPYRRRSLRLRGTTLPCWLLEHLPEELAPCVLGEAGFAQAAAWAGPAGWAGQVQAPWSRLSEQPSGQALQTNLPAVPAYGPDKKDP